MTDCLFGISGDDFVVLCADKNHSRSIVKMDVRDPFNRACIRVPARGARRTAPLLMRAPRHTKMYALPS